MTVPHTRWGAVTKGIMVVMWSVPMKGLHHFRTTVQKGIELAKTLTSSGMISGRVKPMYAAMTDIGKITFYEGVIKENRDQAAGLLLAVTSIKPQLVIFLISLILIWTVYRKRWVLMRWSWQ